MRLLRSSSLNSALLLLAVIIPISLAGYRPGHLQLRHDERRMIEERSLLGSLSSLLIKRDDCTTQFGPTWVDCGSDGCYQPSLGEICCADEGGTLSLSLFLVLGDSSTGKSYYQRKQKCSCYFWVDYCYAGQFCVGLNCCPDVCCSHHLSNPTFCFLLKLPLFRIYPLRKLECYFSNIRPC